eukprot:GHVH01009632.1.p1 GENE.GHVH01009632.1~~GHVH01009632.1.p1  ORF type:complete len:152 (-),score=17.45 GHVH01009632.1:2-457(-)
MTRSNVHHLIHPARRIDGRFNKDFIVFVEAVPLIMISYAVISTFTMQMVSVNAYLLFQNLCWFRSIFYQFADEEFTSSFNKNEKLSSWFSAVSLSEDMSPLSLSDITAPIQFSSLSFNKNEKLSSWFSAVSLSEEMSPLSYSRTVRGGSDG